MKVFITGASGYIGNSLCREISLKFPEWKIFGTDLKPPQSQIANENFNFSILNIVNREEVVRTIQSFQPDSIVHLASILNPPPGMSEEIQRSIDVDGTKNVLDSAIQAKTEQVIITSSGAAYGYHRDNPDWLRESDPIRGHHAFAYSIHKKEVESLMEDYKKSNPQLKQLILRPGTVLGKTVNNLITDLFKKPVVMGISGSQSPFVFIWDEDVIQIILKGIQEKKEGIYNLAGDGALSLKEIADYLGKTYLPLPAGLVSTSLAILHKLRLSQYGPDQIDFLRYRPVLLNEKLKSEFGYTPKYTSKEAFFEFLNAKGMKIHAN